MIHIISYCTNEDRAEMLKTTAAMFDVNLQLIVQDQSEYIGFESKIFTMKTAIEVIPDNDIVCFIDAYDVLVNGTVEEVMHKFMQFNSDIVIGAEMNSYPEGYDNAYPYTGSKTNYKYVNSGGYIGYKHALAKLFDWKGREDICKICSIGGDQHYFIQYYLAHVVPETCILGSTSQRHICLDTEEAIFQNMFKTNWKEFEFISGRLYNCALEQNPCFIHFNGDSWKLEAKPDTYPCNNIMPLFIEHMVSSKTNSDVVYNLNGFVRCTWGNGLICNSLQ
jgi:hypothetical protein